MAGAGKEVRQDPRAAGPPVGSAEECGGDPQDVQGGEAAGEPGGPGLRHLGGGHEGDEGDRQEPPHQPASQVLGYRHLCLASLLVATWFACSLVS